MGNELEEKLDLGSLTIEQLNMISAAANGFARKKKGEKARQEGRAYARLEDIPNLENHTHKFEKVKKSDSFSEPETYRCDCRMIAYKCNNCGFVPGLPRQKKYDNIGVLCGTAGEHLHCSNCDEQVGTIVLKRS